VIRRVLIGASFAVLLISFNRSCLAEDATLAEPELTEQNYAAWRDHVLPAESDLGWQQIPWLTTFKDGILDANQRNAPLLFWTMNGHPLGCT